MRRQSKESTLFLFTVVYLVPSLTYLHSYCAGLYLSKAPFSIVELVESASRSLVVQCHSKGLEIVVHLGKTLRKYGSERQLIGDAQRINQIITNLVSNAKKFTPAGYVVEIYYF